MSSTRAVRVTWLAVSCAPRAGERIEITGPIVAGSGRRAGSTCPRGKGPRGSAVDPGAVLPLPVLLL